MINVKFPANPTNGMIFEIIPGVFYKYNSGSNSWIRLKGAETLGLATPLTDGLMSSADFKKLQNLIVPPPQATLKGEDCNTTFKSGTVALYSFDGSLDISKNPRLVNKVASIDTESPWALHENTAGFDFRVPIDNLLQEIEERNLLKRVQLQGDKGTKGPRGDAGKDRVNTGPVGATGPDGSNSPFTGSLTAENIPFESVGRANRAIVDITTEEISDTENYLVATRANIGNPDACPSLITPQDFSSAFVVALNTIQGGKLVKDQLVSTDDCALICRICASSIHYLNMEEIMNEIFQQFVTRVKTLKKAKEDLAKVWLNTMVSLFNEQKGALCCALENCRSRNRNQRTRQYIETQRIQAALGNFQLLVDGKEDRQLTDMDSHKNCPVPVETVPSVVTDGDNIIVSLDSKIHISDPRANPLQAVTTFLSSGSYVAEITSCCANFNASVTNPKYSGRVGILYKGLVSVGDVTAPQTTIDTAIASFPDFGTFTTEAAARNSYQGLTISFEHAGGDISLWLLDSDGFTANNSGIVTITISPAEEASEVTAEEAIGFLYVYRDEISFDGLLGRVTPFSGSLTASENFGSLSGEVDLTHGPTLLKDRAQAFFYEGSDGLSFFFVAGAQAGSGNDQEANLLVDIDVSNNTLPLMTRAADSESDVRRLSASQFQIVSTINGDSAGFAIGEIDPLAEYSIRVDPRDLSTMRTFVAADAAGNDIIISQGGSEGIGGNISATQINSAPIYEVRDIPAPHGGNNTDGLRVNNESGGQNVTLARPITLDISATFGRNPNNLVTTINTVAVPVENVRLDTTSYADQDMASGGWSATVRVSGNSGTSTTQRRTQGGNPGPYRETTHNTSAQTRVMISSSRPTDSFFGPGSTSALPWDQFFAVDQFGNVWIAIRDVSSAANPTRNGANAIYLRDAVGDEIVTFKERAASAVFGGASGVAPGSSAQPAPAFNSIIATYHTQVKATFSPRNTGAINHLDFSVDAIIIPTTVGSATNSIPLPTATTNIPTLSDAEKAALLAEQDSIENELQQIQFEISAIIASTSSAFSGEASARISALNNRKTTLQARYAEIEQLLAPAPVPVPTAPSSTSASTVSTGIFNVGAIVVQNGNIYRSIQSLTISSTNWISQSQNRLGPANFILVTETGLDSNNHPDFSASAPDINLGYFVESTHTRGNDSRVIGIDNWKVSVKAEVAEVIVDPEAPPVPENCVINGVAVTEESSVLPRGADGSPQDSTIVDINTSLRAYAPQSLRYILTDTNGVKYYSAYRSIDITRLGDFQFFSFGAPISVLAPPAEFTPDIIAEQKLDLSIISDQLSSEQLKVAESLDGIARLTYVQELLGTSIDAVPNGRNMTDIEVEFKNMPFSSVDFGYLSATVGLPGATTEIMIDDFELDTEVIGQTQGEPERVTGSIKRVVAIQNGTDSSTTGLIYSGFDSYYGDYGFGPPAFVKNAAFVPDLHGNQFFTINQAGRQKITHINDRTGFQDLTTYSGSLLTTTSGNVTGTDALVVDDFGVVYVADGPAGQVIAYLSLNAGINNSAFTDATGGAANIVSFIGTNLPVTNNAIIAIGRHKMLGTAMANDLIVNFGGRWFNIDSISRTLFANGRATREDVTTDRCCFGTGSPGPSRAIAHGISTSGAVELSPGSSGISITTTAPANPQPSLPVPSSRIDATIANAIQAQLDIEFNQFEYYTLEDGKVYLTTPVTGARTLYRNLGENAICLRAHPRTKDLYYIVDDRGTSPKSGTIIKRIDINDFDEAGLPKIKTVYVAEDGEGIFGITFGNSVPSDSTLRNQVLYVMLSTLVTQDSGQNIRVRIVEIAEQIIPPVPSGPISQEIPLNSRWNTYVSGGRRLGNPSRVIFSRLIPGGGCQLHYKQVQWYERGWRIGACCGALVEVGGVHYIVVKRSIGTDTTCGGGESLNTACIRQFIEIGDGHPAIAWPTSPDFDDVPGGGGHEFLGLPTSGFVNFVKDETLSNTILETIRAGSSIRVVGDPANEIPFILFPVA